MADQGLGSFLTAIENALKEYIPFEVLMRLLPEMGHLSPIILSFGAAFISAITLNFPLFMLSASTVEAYFVYNALSVGGTLIATPTTSFLHTKELSPACQSHFQTVTPSRFKYLLEKGIRKEFPNSPLYFICFVAAYCIQSMFFLSEECSEFGPQYSNRPYLALISSGMFILLYLIYLLSYGCDSWLPLLFTILLGLFVGYFISTQNYLLFGKNSINLLFLPTLGRKSGMDYICVTTNPTINDVNISGSYDSEGKKIIKVSWAPIERVTGYDIKLYSNKDATVPAGPYPDTARIETQSAYPSVSTINMTAISKDTGAKHYFATVTGKYSNGSTTVLTTSTTIYI